MGILVDQNSNINAEDNWALITDLIVVNLITGYVSDVSAISSDYDYLVDYTVGGQTVEIGYSYDPIHDTFSAPVVTLSEAIATTVSNFQSDWSSYVYGYYPQATQLEFLLTQYVAKQNNDTAVEAYIAPLLSWLYTLNIFSGTMISTIQAMTDVTAVQNLTWNIGASTGAVPNITLLGASQLP
jgi:hypothetical protein